MLVSGLELGQELVKLFWRQAGEAMKMAWFAPQASNSEHASRVPQLRNGFIVSESTVKTHVDHILAKLGVSDRVQAAVWAAQHGLAPELE